MSGEETTWITLTDGKSFSRLLYPNPVCFLGTLKRQRQRQHNHDSSSIDHQSPVVITAATEKKNVMVLSWLTAIDNDGRFVFAINRRRYTAEILDRYFTLSVPVRGMEDLVLNVGAVSGKDVNKIQFEAAVAIADNDGPIPPAIATLRGSAKRESLAAGSSTATVDFSSLSRRKKRKMLAENGVPGLYSEPFGQTQDNDNDDDQSLFAIRSTVAQMACEVTGTVALPVTDETTDHVLLYHARVVAARVDSNYWDATKLLFRPMAATTAPYLTFFGSQTFGYVHNGAVKQE